MCYEKGVHRLLQKQGRVLLEHWGHSQGMFTKEGMLDAPAVVR